MEPIVLIDKEALLYWMIPTRIQQSEAMARRKKTAAEKSIHEMADELASEAVRGRYKDGKLTSHGRSLAKLMVRIMPDEKVDEWGWNLSRKERAAIKKRAAEKKAAPPPRLADAGNPPPQPRQRQPTTRCLNDKEGERMKILNTLMNLFKGGSHAGRTEESVSGGNGRERRILHSIPSICERAVSDIRDIRVLAAACADERSRDSRQMPPDPIRRERATH